MPIIKTQIEINRSPEQVRQIFLDFPSLPSYHKTHFTSIETLSSTSPIDLQKGDKLKVALSGMTFQPTVLTNTPSEFAWRGGSPWIMIMGDHSFRFEPSKTTPGSTTLYQEENFHGLLGFVMASEGLKAKFESFNEDLKRKCESL